MICLVKGSLVFNNKIYLKKYNHRVLLFIGSYSSPRLLVVFVGLPAKPPSSCNNDSSNRCNLSGLPLSESETAAVYVLENVSLTDSKQVLHGDQIINSISEEGELGLPGTSEHLHVFNGHLAFGAIG